MSDRPELLLLSERCKLVPAYIGHDGNERRMDDATRECLLDALGIDASTETKAAETLRELAAEADKPGLAPVRVVRAGSQDLTLVELRVPAERSGRVRYRIQLELETGERHALEGELEPEGARATLPVPAVSELGFGYHRLDCDFEREGQHFNSSQNLIVAPPSCVRLSELIGGRKALGIWTHVYSLRGQRSAGIGDLADLAQLCRWAAGNNLEFVGINPLHASDNAEPEVSPYYPLSRLYANPIYIALEPAVERVGAGASEARALLHSHELEAERLALEAQPRVDYTHAYRHKRRVLEAAHRAFLAFHAGDKLAREYHAFRKREGHALEDFAIFCALRERLQAEDRAHADFRNWPPPYRDPRSSAVVRFAAENAHAVDFHAYLQFELDAQLALCERAARGSGMAIGLYGDLALGDAPSAADVWAAPGLYARKVNIGAPPDAYSERGQDWGLLPFNPLALARDGYLRVRALLRRTLRHVGAVRIDHVMGLSRQFWVPAGSDARQGGYVRFPLQDLLGILALESRRARTIVVGEDLGVVEDGFRERMAEQAVLRSQVLYFEHASPRGYARNALATIGTHDLPPLAGFWSGTDLERRRKSDNLASDEALLRAREQREQQKQHLLALLRREGLLADAAGEPSPEALSEALQLMLASAASRLTAFALDDLTLEREALNTPASFLPGEPNWSRRTRQTLAEIAADPRIRALLRKLGARARNA